jgi:threonine dehydratase
MSDEPKNNNNKFIIGAVIALVLVCCCCGGGGIFSAIGTGALTRFNARMKVEQVSMNALAKAEGTLVIKARRVDKTWIYEAVHVDVGGESIDLMPVDSLELVETSE